MTLRIEQRNFALVYRGSSGSPGTADQIEGPEAEHGGGESDENVERVPCQSRILLNYAQNVRYGEEPEKCAGCDHISFHVF